MLSLPSTDRSQQDDGTHAIPIANKRHEYIYVCEPILPTCAVRLLPIGLVRSFPLHTQEEQPVTNGVNSGLLRRKKA